MKKLISACLAVLVVLTCCLTASAASNSKILHAYYSFSEEYLVTLGAPLPPEGTTTITLASQERLAVETATVADVGLGTTVYCLVDTSSAMLEQAQENAVAILNRISEALGKDDSMVITTMGETIEESPLLTAPETRSSAISKIKFDSKSTDLYLAVNDALDGLMTKTDYNFNKCLVVLSDGRDDGRTSVTEDTVLNKIEKSTIPVFGVGLLQDYPSDFLRGETNTLDRMAEASVGGFFFETSKKGSSIREVSDGIWAAMQNASVFLVNLNGLNRSKVGDTLLFTVRYDTKDAVYEDSITILAADLPYGRPVSGGQGSAMAAAGQAAEKKEFPVMLVVAACIAAAVVIAAVVVVIMMKKKSAGKAQTGSAAWAGTIAAVDQMGSVTKPIAPENSSTDVRESPSFATVPLEPAGPTVQLRLTVIGRRDQVFDFSLTENQPKTIGRDDRADVVLQINGEMDTKMSGCHCTIQWSGGRLFVSDNQSTNCTFVDGAQVIPGSLQQLEHGSVLRIGSREYRLGISTEA